MPSVHPGSAVSCPVRVHTDPEDSRDGPLYPTQMNGCKAPFAGMGQLVTTPFEPWAGMNVKEVPFLWTSWLHSKVPTSSVPECSLSFVGRRWGAPPTLTAAPSSSRASPALAGDSQQNITALTLGLVQTAWAKNSNCFREKRESFSLFPFH